MRAGHLVQMLESGVRQVVAHRFASPLAELSTISSVLTRLEDPAGGYPR